MGRGQYGDFDDDEAIAAARRSYDSGINLFDTAAVYGWGYGEKLMGKAVAPFRNDIVLVTKGGREWVRDNPDRTAATVSISDRATLLRSIDESLERLNTDYIDLFLIHWPDHTRSFEEPMRALEDAKAAGKIRHTGVSNFSPEMMAQCREHSPIVTNQIGYHIFDRRPESGVMPFVEEERDGRDGLRHFGAWPVDRVHGRQTTHSETTTGGPTAPTLDWHRSGRKTSLRTSQWWKNSRASPLITVRRSLNWRSGGFWRT